MHLHEIVVQYYIRDISDIDPSLLANIIIFRFCGAKECNRTLFLNKLED